MHAYSFVLHSRFSTLHEDRMYDSYMNIRETHTLFSNNVVRCTLVY